MEIFKSAVQELEKNETSAADIFIILADLRNKLKSRYDEKFFGYQVHQLLKKAKSTQRMTHNFKKC